MAMAQLQVEQLQVEGEQWEQWVLEVGHHHFRCCCRFPPPEL